jgi:hypothetical protein
MKLKDLRVGNYLAQGWVYSLNCAEPLRDSRFSDRDLVTLFDNGIITLPIEEVNPIQITEDLLIKLGFTKKTNTDYILAGTDILLDYFDEWSTDFYFGNVRIREIKWIHQLQNLVLDCIDRELVLSQAGLRSPE